MAAVALDIPAVYGEPAVRILIVPQQQVEQGRLAGPALPHDRVGLALLKARRYMVQDGLVLRIAEADAVKGDLPHILQPFALVPGRGLMGEDSVEAVNDGPCGLELRRDVDDLRSDTCHLSDEIPHNNNISPSRPAMEDQPYAVGQGRRGGDDAHAPANHPKQDLQVSLGHFLVLHIFVISFMPAHDPVIEGKCLDDHEAAEVVLQMSCVFVQPAQILGAPFFYILPGQRRHKEAEGHHNDDKKDVGGIDPKHTGQRGSQACRVMNTQIDLLKIVAGQVLDIGIQVRYVSRAVSGVERRNALTHDLPEEVLAKRGLDAPCIPVA